MKFNCGLSRDEKREIERNAERQERYRLSAWHPYFCWTPTRITGTHDCYWLVWIVRKGEYHKGYSSCSEWWSWEYSLPQEKR